jgi:hypothetical protein
MATTKPIHCVKCGTPLDAVHDAYLWIDRPVCQPCFRQLMATRGVPQRALWRPMVLLFLFTSIAMAAMLMCQVAPSPQPAVIATAPRTETPVPVEQAPRLSTAPIPATPTEIAGLSRADILRMLKGDRTWYWHWGGWR